MVPGRLCPSGRKSLCGASDGREELCPSHFQKQRAHPQLPDGIADRVFVGTFRVWAMALFAVVDGGGRGRETSGAGFPDFLGRDTVDRCRQLLSHVCDRLEVLADLIRKSHAGYPAFLRDLLFHFAVYVGNARVVRGSLSVAIMMVPCRDRVAGEALAFQVMKLGGSLLLLPDLVDRLGRWWQHLQERHVDATSGQWLVVVGGGALVDVVRLWDQVHPLSPRDSHQLALAGMQVTARLIARLMDWPLLEFPIKESTGAEGAVGKRELHSFGAFELGKPGEAATDRKRPIVVDLSAAVAEDSEVPESWEVTSDSLAMWLATKVGARRLVLLKAVSPLESLVKIGKIEDLGWVDAFFSRMWSAEPGTHVEIAYFSHFPQFSQVQGA